MSEKKIRSSKDRQGQSPKQQTLNKILIIDDNDVDLFINESLLKEVRLSREVKREISPANVISQLKKTEKLADVPDLIFIDLQVEGKSGLKFLDEFSSLSDFIRNKCKIIVIAGAENYDEKSQILLNPNVIRYLVKPLDIIQLKYILSLTNKA
jgi:response regulator of citrate/malate metabolism